MIHMNVVIMNIMSMINIVIMNVVVIVGQTSELGVTEHIEGDPCKLALWVGRTPTSDNKTVLKVTTILQY